MATTLNVAAPNAIANNRFLPILSPLFSLVDTSVRETAAQQHHRNSPDRPIAGMRSIPPCAAVALAERLLRMQSPRWAVRSETAATVAGPRRNRAADSGRADNRVLSWAHHISPASRNGRAAP